ncbi:MAG: MerR family transcriptional regulator [Nannocystaceae bacterium]
MTCASLDLGTDKLYFKIGEVSDIVDVPAHVLRYWETEFKGVRPQKSRAKQRVYRRRDVELLLKIKHLLYAEKFTIAGARQQLAGGGATALASPSPRYQLRQSLAAIREQLSALAKLVRSETEHDRRAADPAAYLGAAPTRAAAESPEEPGVDDPVDPEPATIAVRRTVRTEETEKIEAAEGDHGGIASTLDQHASRDRRDSH